MPHSTSRAYARCAEREGSTFFEFGRLTCREEDPVFAKEVQRHAFPGEKLKLCNLVLFLITIDKTLRHFFK